MDSPELRSPESDSSDYRLMETLTPDRTFLCSDASSNVVVLVRLEEDCLYRGGLHPSIRDRLARVRELPHARVAMLRGVERWNGLPCIVWIFLDGETWDDAIRQNPDSFPALASSLTTAVLGLHDLGLVHGNLHERNVIVRPNRQPWLTHISPYLYADPAVDHAALVHLLKESSRHLEPQLRDRVTRLLDEFASQQSTLKELSQALLKSGEGDVPDFPVETPAMVTKHRHRSLAAAITVTLAAVALAIVVHRSFSKPVKVDPPVFSALKRELH